MLDGFSSPCGSTSRRLKQRSSPKAPAAHLSLRLANWCWSSWDDGWFWSCTVTYFKVEKKVKSWTWGASASRIDHLSPSSGCWVKFPAVARALTVRLQRLHLFLLLLLHPHTEHRKFSTVSRERPIANALASAAWTNSAASDPTTGCKQQQAQLPEKKKARPCSWLLFSMLIWMQVLSLLCTSCFFYGFPASLPFFTFLLFHLVSKIILPDSLRSPPRTG